MRILNFACIALSLIPLSLYAETTLYACTKDGQTTLESTPSQDCDKLQTYKYQTSQPNKANESEGLRPSEIQALQSMDANTVTRSMQINRYQNVDNRVGWGIAGDYIDSRQDKCASFYNQANHILAQLGVDENHGHGDKIAFNEHFTLPPDYHITIDHADINQDSLLSQLKYTQSQIDYYCH
ncbi:MAG: hypothetical protein JSR17_00140 [Proteobacteria bacterium]|nr:hypothetical protein [Pseudomonadota bacterium]